MSAEEDIAELRDLLQNLRIQHTQTAAAIARVERILNNEERGNREPRVVQVQAEAVAIAQPVLRNLQLRDFEQGQRVRILNPARGEEDVGVVTGIGTRFVNICRTNSRPTRRIPRNLEIIEDV